MLLEIKLPELGDNVESGTVVSIFVAVGDVIEEDQGLIELETDKAVIEVPATEAGTVKKVLINEGDEIKTGQVFLEIETEAGQQQETAPAAVPENIPEAPVQVEPAQTSAPTAPQVAVATAGGLVDFEIPDLGDGVDSAVVASILVKVGDTIELEQGLFELETDKAVIEVPSEIVGIVKEILLKEGDTISKGQKVMVIETQTVTKSAASTPPPAPAASQPTPPPPPEKKFVSGEKEMQEPVHGPVSKKVFEPAKSKIAPASPTVRRFAREIGIDIHEVPGSGPGGRISIDDVKAFSITLHKQKSVGQVSGTVVEAEPLPDFSKYGTVEREGLNKLRQTSANHLSNAWVTIPHVTQHDKADITNIEKLRKANGRKAEAMGGKLTMTAILIKVIEAALRKFPEFNASIDMANKEIVYKKYYNVGIAVDTPRGLLVPVVKGVDNKNILQLAAELTEISKKARDKKLTLDDMQGGNFTISNLGGIGGTGFTPIVNAPEVAILGVSRAKMEPVYIDGDFEPRLMMPLALSYDHRVIDGASAARFLRWVCNVLEQPFNVLLEG